MLEIFRVCLYIVLAVGLGFFFPLGTQGRVPLIADHGAGLTQTPPALFISLSLVSPQAGPMGHAQEMSLQHSKQHKSSPNPGPNLQWSYFVLSDAGEAPGVVWLLCPGNL